MHVLFLDLMQAERKPETRPSSMYFITNCFLIFACRASTAHVCTDGCLLSVFPASTSPPIHRDPRVMFYTCSPVHVTLLLKTSQRLLVPEKKNQISFRGLLSSINTICATASLSQALTWSRRQPCWHECSAVLQFLQRAKLPPTSGLNSSGSQTAGLFVPIIQVSLECHLHGRHLLPLSSPSGLFCCLFLTALIPLCNFPFSC